MPAVLLDAGPLGLASSPAGRPEAARCAFWIRSLPSLGYRVVIPEIADYEVRRELLRAGKHAGVRRLDALKTVLDDLAITTESMLLAAQLWAQARRQGQPTAHDHALDGDMILAPQAKLVEQPGERVVVATTNVGHRARFVDARLWTDIP